MTAPTVGFPRMHKEAGERRDFLPDLVSIAAEAGSAVVVESGIGSGMTLRDEDYTGLSPLVRAGDADEAFSQDIVLVLRAPTESFRKIRPGATLLSMLHFPTQPDRVRLLERLGIEAISLDQIEDDAGRRLVVNGRAVAWNGLEAAFDTLEAMWPDLHRVGRGPIRVTILGAGEIGRHAVEASTKYGRIERAERLTSEGCLGVEVVTIGRNLTSHPSYLNVRLRDTDVLVDATQRSDPSLPVVRNRQIGLLPDHAVICDLAVDPYALDAEPPTVRGIEGIPQGNLDRYVFDVDDPAWTLIPPSVPTANRRRVVSCYSWPGVHPRACMDLYGEQLEPLLQTLIERGGAAGLRSTGPFHERALYRASLRAWIQRTRPSRHELLIDRYDRALPDGDPVGERRQEAPA
jgi:alanine dehydrogenase